MELAYEHQWRKKFGLRLYIGRLVQSVFGGNRSTSTFLKLMHHVPLLAKLIIKSTHGSKF